MGLKKERSEKENKIISERLRKLVGDSEVAEVKVAEAIDISPAYFRMILNGDTAPTYSVLMWLADYFCVSMDYICGRVELPDAYDFSKIRMHAYEDYLKSKKGIDHNYKKIVGEDTKQNWGSDRICSLAPWPYNLVEDILGYECDFLMCDDQIAGLEHVLSLLSHREGEILREHYKNDVAVADVAGYWGVSSACAYQILRRALKKCRTKAMFRFIKEGVTLKKLNDEHDILVKKLQQENEKLQYAIDHAEEKKEQIKELKYLKDPLMRTLEELDLSVRLYNCLKRADLDNVAEILAFERDDSDGIMRIRGIGKGTYEELRGKLLYFGYDISEIRNGSDRKPFIKKDPEEIMIDELDLDLDGDSNYPNTKYFLKCAGIKTVADVLNYRADRKNEYGYEKWKTIGIDKSSYEKMRIKLLPYGYDISKPGGVL